MDFTIEHTPRKDRKIKEGYSATIKAYSGDLSSHELVEFYDRWAETGDYDQHLSMDHYTGPECAARTLAGCFYDDNEKSVAQVLDVAAGTGKVGVELHKLGFRNVTALDPSKGMLSHAKERNVYSDFISSFFGIDYPLPCPDDKYDGLTCSGGFGEGHIKSSAILEMVRIVKPGGYIIIAMREEYVDQVEDYKINLYPLLSSLEKDGRMQVISKDVIPNYAFQKTGLLFKIKVL